MRSLFTSVLGAGALALLLGLSQPAQAQHVGYPANDCSTPGSHSNFGPQYYGPGYANRGPSVPGYAPYSDDDPAYHTPGNYYGPPSYCTPGYPSSYGPTYHYAYPYGSYPYGN